MSIVCVQGWGEKQPVVILRLPLYRSELINRQSESTLGTHSKQASLKSTTVHSGVGPFQVSPCVQPGRNISWAVNVQFGKILGINLGLYFRKHPGMARAQVTFHRAAEKWDIWLFAIRQCQHNLGNFTQHCWRWTSLTARGKRAALSRHSVACVIACSEIE